MKYLALAVAACILGCTPQAKRAPTDTPLTNDLRATYVFTMKQLVTARKAGLVSDAEKKEIEVVRLQAVAALDSFEQAELAGVDLVSNREKLNALLDKLIQWAARKKGPS